MSLYLSLKAIDIVSGGAWGRRPHTIPSKYSPAHVIKILEGKSTEYLRREKTMGFLAVLISAVAAVLFYKTGQLSLMIFAVTAALGSFWTWAVLSKEPQTAPKWIKWINLAFTIIGIALLFTGITKIYEY
jgi:hypothetical protein